MLWDDLLTTADDLVVVRGRNRKPRQANLRRAVSTAYYAMFHCLAQCCADMLVGSTSSNRSKHAWRQAYRALEHRNTSKKCKRNEIHEFPKAVEDFANAFVSLQEKRHSADYDPISRFSKLEVVRDISTARNAIDRFRSVPTKDRRAFAAFVLFTIRNE